MRRLVILLLGVVLWQPSQAQKLRYAGAYLQHAAKVLKLDMSAMDTLVEADTLLTVNGLPIHLRIHDRRVEHIGWHLFNRQLRTLNPSPVYDYLEYACLDNHVHFTDDPFVYEKLLFRQGDWKAMTQINETVPCDISLLENRVYQVRWQDEKHHLEVAFPLGYERLYMVTRRELEARFLDDLEAYTTKERLDTPVPDIKDLKKVNDSIYCKPGDFYQLTLVNQNLYFQQTKRMGLVLLWDKSLPAESLANLCISNDGWLNSFPIELHFITYDRKERVITVPIGRLLSLAKETGCKPYFGVERLEADRLDVALFFYNPAYGYDHVFRISCNPQLMNSTSFKMKGQGALYAPTTNIANLFSNKTGKSTPKKY